MQHPLFNFYLLRTDEHVPRWVYYKKTGNDVTCELKSLPKDVPLLDKDEVEHAFSYIQSLPVWRAGGLIKVSVTGTDADARNIRMQWHQNSQLQGYQVTGFLEQLHQAGVPPENIKTGNEFTVYYLWNKPIPFR